MQNNTDANAGLMGKGDLNGALSTAVFPAAIMGALSNIHYELIKTELTRRNVRTVWLQPRAKDICSLTEKLEIALHLFQLPITHWEFLQLHQLPVGNSSLS
jgi:hypothetical protein